MTITLDWPLMCFLTYLPLQLVLVVCQLKSFMTFIKLMLFGFCHLACPLVSCHILFHHVLLQASQLVLWFLAISSFIASYYKRLSLSSGFLPYPLSSRLTTSVSACPLVSCHILFHHVLLQASQLVLWFLAISSFITSYYKRLSLSSGFLPYPLSSRLTTSVSACPLVSCHILFHHVLLQASQLVLWFLAISSFITSYYKRLSLSSCFLPYPLSSRLTTSVSACPLVSCHILFHHVLLQASQLVLWFLAISSFITSYDKRLSLSSCFLPYPLSSRLTTSVSACPLVSCHILFHHVLLQASQLVLWFLAISSFITSYYKRLSLSSCFLPYPLSSRLTTSVSACPLVSCHILFHHVLLQASQLVLWFLAISSFITSYYKRLSLSSGFLPYPLSSRLTTSVSACPLVSCHILFHHVLLQASQLVLLFLAISSFITSYYKRLSLSSCFLPYPLSSRLTTSVSACPLVSCHILFHHVLLQASQLVLWFLAISSFITSYYKRLSLSSGFLPYPLSSRLTTSVSACPLVSCHILFVHVLLPSQLVLLFLPYPLSSRLTTSVSACPLISCHILFHHVLLQASQLVLWFLAISSFITSYYKRLSLSSCFLPYPLSSRLTTSVSACPLVSCHILFHHVLLQASQLVLLFLAISSFITSYYKRLSLSSGFLPYPLSSRLTTSVSACPLVSCHILFHHVLLQASQLVLWFLAISSFITSYYKLPSASISLSIHCYL